MPQIQNINLEQKIEFLENEIKNLALYTDYLAKCLDSTISYSEYLAGLINQDYIGFDEWKNQDNRTRRVKVKAEDKRVYTAEDPYGEEVWED